MRLQSERGDLRGGWRRVRGILLLAAFALCCLAGSALADEWNDTFSTPREFIVKRNMTARGGPGNSFAPLGIVPGGTSIWVTGIQNGWHCFKLVDGRSAYIFRRYLKPADKEQRKQVEEKNTPPQQNVAEKKEPGPQQEKKSQQAVAEKKESESEEKSVPEAASDSEFDEPIVLPPEQTGPEAGDAPDSPAEQDADDEPVLYGDPPEPPLLEEAPQSPEDEPVPPEKTAAPDAEEEAVKPETRPVRSSSFGTDGCAAYKRIAFAPESKETLLNGKLTSGEKVCYRFLGIAGSTVSLGLEPADSAVVFDVYTPASGHIGEKQKNFSWLCASTGDKIIVLTSRQTADFSLKVTLSE